jgi:hypothetical protein
MQNVGATICIDINPKIRSGCTDIDGCNFIVGNKPPVGIGIWKVVIIIIAIYSNLTGYRCTALANPVANKSTITVLDK